MENEADIKKAPLTENFRPRLHFYLCGDRDGDRDGFESRNGDGKVISNPTMPRPVVIPSHN